MIRLHTVLIKWYCIGGVRFLRLKRGETTCRQVSMATLFLCPTSPGVTEPIISVFYPVPQLSPCRPVSKWCAFLMQRILVTGPINPHVSGAIFGSLEIRAYGRVEWSRAGQAGHTCAAHCYTLRWGPAVASIQYAKSRFEVCLPLRQVEWGKKGSTSAAITPSVWTAW